MLLPALARHAGADDPDIQRILAEHADFRRRIAELDSEPRHHAGALNELGELLSDHVRYEERTVFGRIEATLAPDELDAIGSHLHAAERAPPTAGMTPASLSISGVHLGLAHSPFDCGREPKGSVALMRSRLPATVASTC